MKKIVITGYSSNISEQLIKIIETEKNTEIIKCGRGKKADIKVDFSSMKSIKSFIKNIIKKKPTHLIICHGVLYGKKINDLKEIESIKSVMINMISVIIILENITKIKNLNTVVISSISGKKGSFDNLYAATKSGVNLSVKTISKQIDKSSRLNIISPGIISDARMTLERTDQHNLKEIKNTIPSKKFTTSYEVAELIYYLLFNSKNINGANIDINGGHY